MFDFIGNRENDFDIFQPNKKQFIVKIYQAERPVRF